MTNTNVFNLRYLEESQPSICIPRVFNNIDANKIGNVFEQLQLGKIKRVDMIECKNEKGEKFKRAFVHFEKWNWNEDAQTARRKLIEGKEIKIVYDNPWFWKISANRSNSTPDKREPGPSPQRSNSKPHMELEDEFGRNNSMRNEVPKPIAKNVQIGRRMEDKRRPVEVKLERKAPAHCLSLIPPTKIAPCLPPSPSIPSSPCLPSANPASLTPTDIPYQYCPPVEILQTAIDYGVIKPILKRKTVNKLTIKVVPEKEVQQFLEVKVEDQVVEMSEADKKICVELYGDL